MKSIYKHILLILVFISTIACDRIEILSPPGPRGLSAYEVWVEAVNNKTIQWENGTDLANYFKYIKGVKGDSGKDAFSIWQDWIRDGSVDNPHKPGEKWNPEKNTKRDFYLFLTGAKGDKGDTPFINSKGNWQI
ncbi:MAG: collagen-like protein, partial [Porphyromonas sp.]|nr:collagen-like protein [Porphyromonas sp.]